MSSSCAAATGERDSAILDIARMGFETCVSLDPGLLLPEERIRGFCAENRCGQYGMHHMCPPRVGTVQELGQRLHSYREGFLLRHTEMVNVQDDSEGVKRTKRVFHQKVLETERMLKEAGYEPVWGLIGGECALCEPCRARFEEPCPWPEKARPSLESAGVDVAALLDRFDLDGSFYPDRVTWTGCVLFSV